MGLLPKEQLRQLIKENNIKDVNGIYDTLKDMFKDVLQEMLEAEMYEILLPTKRLSKSKHRIIYYLHIPKSFAYPFVYKLIPV
ncbi:MAG TPA: hypothetical protein PKN88_05475 [Bacillota bacterium]|nr:hypothetical protein [Bacillota bacterium]